MSDPAYRELADLWEAVFGEQPSVVAEPGLLAEILVAYLPRIEPYRFDVEPARPAASEAFSGEANPGSREEKT